MGKEMNEQIAAMARLNGFATHLPVLIACVNHTTGPVVELGCGAYSTPVLHALCQGRELLSLDYNADWYACFKRFGRGSHTLGHVTNWAAEPRIDRAWDVALVDHAPGIRRVPEIKRLKAAGARLIVIHDTEHRSYDYEPTLATFKHRLEWRPYSPWASVVSDIDNLEWLRDVARD